MSEKQGAVNNFPRKLAVVLLLLAFVFFAGAWFLNDGTTAETAEVISLTSPTNGQKIWLRNQTPIRFEWSGKASEDAFLEVSRDRNFQDLVLHQIAPKSPFLTDKLPGDGDYFYRIVQSTSNRGQVPLEPVTFTIVTQYPPQLIYPFTPMAISETKPLRFYWQSKQGVSHYRFQIAFDSNFENLLSNFLLDESQTIPQQIPTGHFFWRVRGEDDPTSITMWSEVRALHSEAALNTMARENPIRNTPVVAFATKIKTRASPRNLPSPKVTQISKKILLRYRGGKSPRTPASIPEGLLTAPTLSWQKSKGASSYDVQISRKMDFSELEWSKSVSTPGVKWTAAKPGKFFWRVQASDETGTKSSFSSIGRLELSLPMPKLEKIPGILVPQPNLPPDGVSIVSLNGSQDPISFRWQNTGVNAYRIEISEDTGFQRILLSTLVKANHITINKPMPKGTLYWRVRAEKGSIKSDWSPAFSFEFAK